eukprot:gene2160-2358_t
MASNQRPSIEFVVKPKQDLYLEGQLRRLPRVAQGEAYPCQMQKNQNFGCLFRHYAKHNGLRKEDLVFFFVDELLPDQTPESVHLMPQDEIWVEHRKVSGEEEKEVSPPVFYGEQFRTLLDKGWHSDITFILDNGLKSIPAHKAILSARSEYFEAMFRVGGMIESSLKEIIISHEASNFKRLLEFIYTNDVRDLATISPEEVISLLVMANEYLLSDLRVICEKRAAAIISVENIGKLLLLSAGHNASVLRDACGDFVQKNRSQLAVDPSFRQDVEANPELGLLLFETSLPKANLVGETGSVSKKRRRTSDSRENDLDLVPPQLNTNANLINTNTIAQSNANVQEI